MLDLGDEAGYQFLAQAIDISPDLVSLLLVELKKESIPFIVAPYEADAQLAYLSRENIVDLIITEDSDLMAFGAKRMLYKVDIATMTCDELTLESIRSCPNNNFTTFTHCMFLTMCILASCDYLKNIKGISI